MVCVFRSVRFKRVSCLCVVLTDTQQSSDLLIVIVKLFYSSLQFSIGKIRTDWTGSVCKWLIAITTAITTNTKRRINVFSSLLHFWWSSFRYTFAFSLLSQHFEFLAFIFPVFDIPALLDGRCFGPLPI